MNKRKEGNLSNQGTVVSVRGSVIDAYFPKHLPELYHQLAAGENGRVQIEVVAHLNAEMVRGIALTPTAGLARGSLVIDRGHSLEVPVGERLLGRMLNVFGEAIDGGEPLRGGEWRSLHARPVSLIQRATTSEILRTGIKAIDVLAPLEKQGCFIPVKNEWGVGEMGNWGDL